MYALGPSVHDNVYPVFKHADCSKRLSRNPLLDESLCRHNSKYAIIARSNMSHKGKYAGVQNFLFCTVLPRKHMLDVYGWRMHARPKHTQFKMSQQRYKIQRRVNNSATTLQMPDGHELRDLSGSVSDILF